MSNLIGIKINSPSSIAKCVSIIRKYNQQSISKIKSHIINHEYILSFDYTDDKGIDTLISCCKELLSNGISVEIYEHERKCNIDFLYNLNCLYNDISKQIDEEMSNENDADY